MSGAEVSEKRRALVGSRGLHEKTEKTGKLIGGGRNKTKNRPELGCRFYFEIRSSDLSAPKKLVGFKDMPPPSLVRSADWLRSGQILS
jgi:hypothetical protein